MTEQSHPTASADPTADPGQVIAFQGVPGAYSHLACREAYPDLSPVSCESFEDAFAMVKEGRAGLGMIPIENSVAGRVADIHHLLPDSGLHIIGEHFQRVRHQLLAVPGTKIEDLKVVHSHQQALSQCRQMTRDLGLETMVHADTAGAAKEVAERGDPAHGAIASSLAGETYGLATLRSHLEDVIGNTTRFVVMAQRPSEPDPHAGPAMTTFVFQVRNVPAALYKAMGGFATNGVNMVKLESYQLGGQFTATQFYADIEGHPAQKNVERALEELQFFCTKLKLLGVYPAHPYRHES